MALREIPNNKEAEMSVLGATFLDRNALVKVCESTTEEMYYNEANQKIFIAIKSLFDNKIPLDITTLKEELDKKKYFNSVGGIEYISEIIDSVATTANLDYYIKIIKDKSAFRDLINSATDIITNVYENDDDITSSLDNAERTILNVTKTRQSSEFKPIRDVLAIAKEKLEQLSKNKHQVTGIETGFPDLDKVTSGFHPGEVIILAARPGMGKTALALNMGVNAAMTTEKAIAIFTLEMPAEQLVNRMISSTGTIDSYKLQTGQMQHNDWKKYNEAMSQLSSTNIYIEDNATITISEIKAKCRRLANQDHGLGLVIIDYLQLITTGSKRIESRQQEVAEISRTLKTMAMELRVPVVALAQLSRNAEKRDNNEPMLTDLRESGQIEQDADLVMFINRKDYFKTKEEINKEKSVPVDIIIAKHRKGATGKFKLTFELNMSNFKSYLGEIEEDE